MAVCFRAPPLRNRARAWVTISRSSRYRLAGTPRIRAVASGVGKGVVITARGREDMAPLYAAEIFGVNAPAGTSLGRSRIMLRTPDAWRRIPAVPSQHILVAA